MVAPLPLILILSLCWIILGLGASALLRVYKKTLPLLFLFSTFSSIALFLITANTFIHPNFMTLTLQWGIPTLPLHFQIDYLSTFFIFLLSTSSIGINCFSLHYFQKFASSAQKIICFYYHLFLASMVWVFLAADIYSFFIAWELMTLSSYFLVVACQPNAEKNHASFLYFLIAHLGALAILISLLLLGSECQNFTFNALRQANITADKATFVFIFMLLGFGAKAGLLPLHVWLPEAHPAAPSPVSALMSGVMLKTALYGMIRVLFDCLQTPKIAWGMTLLLIGSLTALLGIILAAMQTNMKKLLAYSSIENMGVITLTLGLTFLFYSFHAYTLASWALLATLLHCFNHALFKSLLFLSTGCVYHATDEHHLTKLGGLLTKMPWVATLCFIGVLASSGLPPLNGFVSEWLILQIFLSSAGIPNFYLAMLLPILAAAFALTLGLSAYVMVKFYGLLFLGKSRHQQDIRIHDATFAERCGMGWLTIACLTLGAFPSLLLAPLKQVVDSLLHTRLSSTTDDLFFLIFTPNTDARYSPMIFVLVVMVILMVLYNVIRKFHKGYCREVPAWDGGEPFLSSRMQDTAEGFAQPIKKIFASFLQIKLRYPSAFDQKPTYEMNAHDRFWSVIYLPLIQSIHFIAQKFSKFQQGRIRYYLLCSFMTLIVLIGWAL